MLRHAQLAVSAIGALLTASVLGCLCKRGRGRRRRSRPQQSSVEDNGECTCTDLQTLQWLTSSPEVAEAHAPRISAIQVHKDGNATLGYLPPLILTFTELKHLSLVGTSLVHIPFNLPALKQLESLQLSRNTILCVPYEIGTMTTLKSLDLSHNQIGAVPETLCKLTGLTALNLMGNNLKALPENMGSLKNLRILGLKSNKLTQLPQSFTCLASLVELFITDNQLTFLPEGFGNLTSLVKLQASFNSLQQLPVDMLHAPNLELMRVAVCQLDQLPTQLTQLPTQLIHDEEVSGDTGSLVGDGSLAPAGRSLEQRSSLGDAEDPLLWPKLAWFSLGGNGACAPLPGPRPGLEHFSASQLALGDKLGDGASGEVCRATLCPASSVGAAGTCTVAVKTFRSDVSPDGRTQEEVAIACALDHPHLTRVLGVVPGSSCQPPAERPLLVMNVVSGQPMAAKPTSKHLLRCRWAQGESFEASLVLQVAKDMASALGYLHSLNICHGDVYAHNILLDKATGRTTLCDFGASFAYPPTHWFWERMEVRAYGLLLHDLLERMRSLPSHCAPGLQRFQQLVRSCVEAPPRLRLSFKAIGFELEELQPLLLG